MQLSLEMMNEHNSISTLFSSESGVYVVNNHGQISELGVCPFDTGKWKYVFDWDTWIILGFYFIWPMGLGYHILEYV